MSEPLATAPNPLRVLLDGGPTPSVAVSFTDLVDDEEIADAEAVGLDVAELRIDRYASTTADHVVAQARRFSGRVPTLATIRSSPEGGDWSGSDEQRSELFRAVLPHVHGIDVELSSAAALAGVLDAAAGTDAVLVVSHHDFSSTPTSDELSSIQRRGRELGADVVKVAAMTHSMEDLRRLASFTLDHAEDGVIVIGMGPHGAASRVFFPALGSRLTFAYRSHPVAGQLSHGETVELLRRFYPEIGA
ncbi:MAG: type I 3-dehydroquinate dehydratase [Actinobacteria bacterium]|nr:type I 3-dehydroquinate dehydratase [Actinomycetota bacterium]